MEMQQIRYFLALARTLNFTRAAEECDVSQPALTRALQALEGELGGELIRRERGHSHLTDLGKRMLPLMERCFDSAVTAKALAKSINEEQVAPLEAVISHTVNLEIAAGPIAELFRAFPGVQLKLRHGGGDEILEMLKEGVVDIAVAGPIDDRWERLDHWPLFDEPLELAVSTDNRLTFENDPSLAQLKGQPIFSQVGCEMRGSVFRALEDKGLTISNTHEVVTHHDLSTLLEAGLGVAFVPACAPQSKTVRRVRLSDFQLTRRVSAYSVAGRKRGPAAAAFLNLLRSADYGAYSV
jgi:DNA-binding transcriptional LysR family regulator